MEAACQREVAMREMLGQGLLADLDGVVVVRVARREVTDLHLGFLRSEGWTREPGQSEQKQGGRDKSDQGAYSHNGMYLQ